MYVTKTSCQRYFLLLYVLYTFKCHLVRFEKREHFAYIIQKEISTCQFVSARPNLIFLTFKIHASSDFYIYLYIFYSYSLLVLDNCITVNSFFFLLCFYEIL